MAMNSVFVTALGEVMLNDVLLPYHSHQTEDEQLASLDDQERVFVKKVWGLQEAIHPTTSRFRIYGGTAPEELLLVTEFAEFSDDQSAWDEITTVAAAAGAIMDTLHEDNYVDHSWRIGPNGERCNERFGENHGRLRRQVEFRWHIESWDRARIQHLVYRLSQMTESIWDKYGVAVNPGRDVAPGACAGCDEPIGTLPYKVAEVKRLKEPSPAATRFPKASRNLLPRRRI